MLCIEKELSTQEKLSEWELSLPGKGHSIPGPKLYLGLRLFFLWNLFVQKQGCLIEAWGCPQAWLMWVYAGPHQSIRKPRESFKKEGWSLPAKPSLVEKPWERGLYSSLLILQHLPQKWLLPTCIAMFTNLLHCVWWVSKGTEPTCMKNTRSKTEALEGFEVPGKLLRMSSKSMGSLFFCLFQVSTLGLFISF